MMLLDRARDLARRALFAEFKNRIGQLALGRARDVVGGGEPLRGVHAHVQRRVGREGEAALSRVELHG